MYLKNLAVLRWSQWSDLPRTLRGETMVEGKNEASTETSESQRVLDDLYQVLGNGGGWIEP